MISKKQAVYLTTDPQLKKIAAILSALLVLALGMQTPCIDIFEKDTCAIDNCCKDEVPASEDDDTNNPADKSCCGFYNVLSIQDVPALDMRVIPYTAVRHNASEVPLPDKLQSDFWQPPRLG